MDGGAYAGIEVLVQNLINVFKEELALRRDLHEEAEQLQTTLGMIQGYLNDAEKKSITQEAVKPWLKKLEAVASDADIVLDECRYHRLHNELKKTKVLSCFSSFNHIARPQNMAHRIKQINTSFHSMNNNASDLGLQSIVVNAPVAAPASFETDSFTSDPVFIGRDDDVPKLVDMLTIKSEEKKFSILAIVGMGGMGKTTLTRKVFNHQKMKAQFGSIIWVHVSQTFDPIILLKKILASFASETHDVAERREGFQEENNEVTGSRGAVLEKHKKSFKAKPDEGETRENILKNLKKAMKAKTYLLVLDDVWNQDLQKWDDFVNSLSGVTSTKGNVIIITTRNTEVASIVNPLHIHHLNKLSDEDCWSIIKAKAFQNRDIIPSEFEIIGGKIARRCGGLPLAANVVGGVLRDKSEQEWLSIQQKWLSEAEGDSISKILRLSFDNLSSSSLKKCFGYCSIFPKGDKIVKQELIELWMAEGFLQPDRRNDMESVGDKHVNVLLHNSLLQVAERDDYGNVETCGMHDLVHDLATSVYGISQVRYMSHESGSIPKEAAKCLRTLFMAGKISDTKFSDFKCLHALTLNQQFLEELPSSIRKLIHLRNLNISKTWIECLPDWIGELHHLQTLRADTGVLRKLPSTLKYLISLRHLYIDDDAELPPGIGRLTFLQTLTHFTVGNKKGCRIEELGSLTNLKGKLKIFNLEKVRGKEEAEKANIFQKPNLLELSFHWEGEREGECRNDENVLEGLQPHPNLNKLEINGFKGKRFPIWTLKMAVRHNPGGSWEGLNKLTKITLVGCDECEEIPALGQLPNLKSLDLDGFGNVKSINSSFYGIDKDTTIAFPALERLALSSMYLTEWAEVESGPNCEEVKVFPHLQYLDIYSCEQLIKISNICGVKIRSLTEVHIFRLDGLESLPDWLFHNNQALKTLKIIGCPKLRELPDGLDTLNSLEELSIWGCPNLTSIGGRGHHPNGGGVLRSLRIEDCQGLMELPREMVESWAPSLQILSLTRLSSLKNLPVVMECLAKSAHHLRELEIDVSINESSSTGVAIKETVDGLLRECSCHSLVRLYLKGMEIWESLPDSIQNLTALSYLKLENLGIEELPDQWFGNLSSLEELRVYSCKKLRRLPSVDALTKTKLRWIDIEDCPELRIDSEWRKKESHLDIWIDGQRINEPGSEKLLAFVGRCV